MPPEASVESDRNAALEAVAIALATTADGETYVFEGPVRQLAEKIHPTRSFLDPKGAVCRHIEVTVTLESATKHTEAIACRNARGGWSLDG